MKLSEFAKDVFSWVLAAAVVALLIYTLYLVAQSLVVIQQAPIA